MKLKLSLRGVDRFTAGMVAQSRNPEELLSRFEGFYRCTPLLRPWGYGHFRKGESSRDRSPVFVHCLATTGAATGKVPWLRKRTTGPPKHVDQEIVASYGSGVKSHALETRIDWLNPNYLGLWELNQGVETGFMADW